MTQRGKKGKYPAISCKDFSKIHFVWVFFRQKKAVCQSSPFRVPLFSFLKFRLASFAEVINSDECALNQLDASHWCPCHLILDREKHFSL